MDSEKQVKGEKKEEGGGRATVMLEGFLPDRPSSELSSPHTTHFLSKCRSPKLDSSGCVQSATHELHKHTEIQKKTHTYKQITCYSWLPANLKLYRK